MIAKERSVPGGPLVMGILNVTPDSFSDGGRWDAPAAALDHAMAMLAAGADILDVGGESTRPGAAPVAEGAEVARVVPVIAAIRARADATISIDTMKPAVARAAFEAGAAVWNDVTALAHAPDSLATAAALGGGVILMHMQGAPRTMQDNPSYADVVAEVGAYLRARGEAALHAGIARERIWIDPGIGFGKNVAHNLALIARLGALRAAAGFKLAFGASRKRFIAHAAGDAPAQARLGGSLAAALLA
ncbi:MAG: dihydropteroate synthase, partial [Hyphomonadaceae bacterium]